ncbi:MAG: PilZ domain-containing protein [bacterium]|nr:PilZ domain-containing protein [bacterium]
MGDLLILLISKDSFADYICNYLLMDGHYVDTVENIEAAKFMVQVRKYDLLIISSNVTKEEEIAISRQMHKLDPSLRLLFLCRLLTQQAIEISQQEKPYACPIKSLILEYLPVIIKEIQLAKEFETEPMPPNTMPHDRRKEIRASTKILVKYHFSDMYDSFQEEMISKGMDLSKDGIKLVVSDSTRILPYVTLNILLPFSADPIHILGEIKWAREHLRFPWKDVGVKFFNIKTEDLHRITDYINLAFRKPTIH